MTNPPYNRKFPPSTAEMEPKDMPRLENDFYEYACECEFCYRQFWNDDQHGVHCCRWILKGREHRHKISQLVVASSDFVTLIVGPEKERLSCHKILLRYASERLDALVSKDCPSSTRQEIELPDELFEPMTAWIAWIYTGHVPPTCKLTPEALFIFGERLKSPAFRNELMLCLISRYSRMGHKEEFFEDITPKMADYVYQNTVKDSKLRRFVVDWILEVCPLTEDGDNGLHFMRTEKEKEEMRREWRQLIKRNGDLVSEVALRGSWFENSWNQDSVARGFAMDTIEYFEPDRPIEDFLEG